MGLYVDFYSQDQNLFPVPYKPYFKQEMHQALFSILTHFTAELLILNIDLNLYLLYLFYHSLIVVLFNI